jgi:hypothetical protein
VLVKILFLHGWNSAPGGVKPTCLATHGHEVLNPKLPDDDFGEAVRTAQAEFDRHRPQVVVGSSRGGAVAMNIDRGGAKLVLLCPAWRKWGTATSVNPGTVILHSRADDVIPFADSEELAKTSGATLIEVGTDHRLADPEPLAAMLRACGEAGTPTHQTRRGDDADEVTDVGPTEGVAMPAEIAEGPIRFHLHGVGGEVVDGRYGEVGFRLMNEMWRVVQAAGVPTTGVNHWVYLPGGRMFVGVELRTPRPLPIPARLEPLEVELGRHVRHVHVGPYQALPEKWAALKADLAARGEVIDPPSLEVYGHHSDDPSKTETTILIGLRANPA